MNTTQTLPARRAFEVPRSWIAGWKVARRLLTNPASLLGILLIAAFIAIAIAAPSLAPPRNARSTYTIPRDGFAPEPRPPSEKHPFGTTEGQYDIYYGIIWGTRTAFQIGLIITSSTAAIGLVIGSIAGFYGGWLDELLMRIVEIFIAFPFLMAAITVAAVLQAKLGRGLIVSMIALIVFGWTTYARLVRGDILSVKERDYIVAARAVGVKDFRIITRHVLPNSIYPTLVYASMDIGNNVLSFAGLSFLGLGAEVGYADWGQLISFARNWIPSLSRHWYIVVYPGMAILLFVLGWNLLGDAVRDILDPRMRRPH
jgi:peptide/nickel transport system permease protein